jgi:hypothetical protein
MKDPKQLAASLWKMIEANLDDRGCFNGIDDDVMKDLRSDIKSEIAGILVMELRK